MNDQVKLPWKQILIILSLGLLFFLLPPFLKNGLFLGHDTFLHAAYIHAFDDAFFQGQFPVRVIDWFFPGANIPLFNFYQPGFYYFLLIFKLVGFSYSSSLNLGLFLLWILSGMFMFLFIKERFGNSLAGLLSGLLFIFAPYHILDIFVRTAFPEFMALTIIPAWFWSVTRFTKSQKNTWLFASAVCTGTLIIVHPPTAFMFAPVMLVYVGVLAIENKSFALLAEILASLVIGSLFVAFFLLPAITEQQYSHAEMATTNKLYDFHNHFVCFNQFFIPSWGDGLSVKGCNDTMSFQVGIVHWISMGIAFIVIIYSRFFSSKREKNKNFLLSILFIFLFIWSLFMGMQVSLPIWEKIPYVHFILYPWRFLSVSIFIASFLVGYGLSLINTTYAYILYGVCMYGIFYWYTPYLHANVSDNSETGFNSNQYLTDSTQYQTAMFTPDKMFYPKNVTTFSNPQTIPDTEAKVIRGGGSITKISSTATQKIYDISLSSKATIRFFVHYFPGWQINADGQILPVIYSNREGYMDTILEKGNHNITVEFTDTPIRKVGNIISFLTFLGSICFLFIRRATTTKKSER